jgi:hypothetical protein
MDSDVFEPENKLNCLYSHSISRFLPSSFSTRMPYYIQSPDSLVPFSFWLPSPSVSSHSFYQWLSPCTLQPLRLPNLLASPVPNINSLLAAFSTLSSQHGEAPVVFFHSTNSQMPNITNASLWPRDALPQMWLAIQCPQINARDFLSCLSSNTVGLYEEISKTELQRSFT